MYRLHDYDKATEKIGQNVASLKMSPDLTSGKLYMLTIFITAEVWHLKASHIFSMLLDNDRFFSN